MTTKQYVSIGCQCRSVKEWRKGYKRISNIYSLSKEEINICENLVNPILNTFK